MYQIYGKDDCAYCFRAVSLLTQKKLPFKEFKLGKEFTRDELLEMFPQAKTFPQIKYVTPDQTEIYVGGFTELAKQLG